MQYLSLLYANLCTCESCLQDFAFHQVLINTRMEMHSFPTAKKGKTCNVRRFSYPILCKQSTRHCLKANGVERFTF